MCAGADGGKPTTASTIDTLAKVELALSGLVPVPLENHFVIRGMFGYEYS
jgi:hypothetical protein